MTALAVGPAASGRTLRWSATLDAPPSSVASLPDIARALIVLGTRLDRMGWRSRAPSFVRPARLLRPRPRPRADVSDLAAATDLMLRTWQVCVAVDRAVRVDRLPDRAPATAGILLRPGRDGRVRDDGPVSTARHRPGPAAALVAVVAVLGSCAQGGTDPTATGPATASQATADAGQQFPNVVDAVLVPRSATVFDVEVTLSSPYDTADRYADGWRVLAPDGQELGSRELLHDHAGEQPFTRTQSGLEIPPDVTSVVVQGRDLANGYGGGTVEVAVPGR